MAYVLPIDSVCARGHWQETAPEAVDQGAGSRRKAEHMSTESQGGLADREALQSACQGHIWKLDTYGPLE